MSGSSRGARLPEILFEDNHIIVVVKPAGMLSQSDQTGDKDLLEFLREYIQESKGKPGRAFIGLVHRLDRSTGGIMVFARTSKAAARLSEAFRSHKVQKRYIALVAESFDRARSMLGPDGTLKDNYRKDESLRMAVSCASGHPDAKPASLSFRLLRSVSELSSAGSTLPDVALHRTTLIELELHTGRFHQIRYQLSSRGLPIVGDAKYGSRRSDKNLALWAYHLHFPHPIRDTMDFTALPPKDWWSERV